MEETVLLVGGGGREHAIARAVADDAALYACAGTRNPEIAELSAGVERLETTNPTAVRAYAEEIGATLAVIGPEAPLATGVADALDEAGIYAFGPHEREARIETDKAYQRRFMAANDIPGLPAFETFEDAESACEYIDAHEGDLAVKPAGLTGGKGVRVIGEQVTPAEAKAYIRESGYDRLVLEERLRGEEFTVQALVAGDSVRVTPAVQDHKRAFEGDEGPNTGGMGAYSDAGLALPFMNEAEYREAVDIIRQTADALEGYKGVLYGQFMLTAEGVKLIEFNARFGDPEAMNTLPILETDLLDVLVAAREGDRLPQLRVARQATVCKYAVPAGYPTDPEAGKRIEIEETGDGLAFYASVDEREDGLYTTTSRAVAAVGIADTIAAAERIAERTLPTTNELRVRHDIGTADSIDRRIAHLDRLRGR